MHDIQNRCVTMTLRLFLMAAVASIAYSNDSIAQLIPLNRQTDDLNISSERFELIANDPRPVNSPIPASTSPIKLVVFTFEKACRMARGIRLTESGETASFSMDPTRTVQRFLSGTPAAQLPKEVLLKLEDLLNSLPEMVDPPEERERALLLRFQRHGVWCTLAYDRFNLPPQLISLLHIMNADHRFGAWVIQGQLQRIIRVDSARYFPQLVVSQNGQTAIYAGTSESIRLVDSDRFEVGPGKSLGSEGLSHLELHPNGRYVLTRLGSNRVFQVLNTQTWTEVATVRIPESPARARDKSIRAAFSTDGSHIVISYSIEAEPITVDVANWTVSDAAPSIPDDVHWYYQSSDKSRAVVWHRDGKLTLWGCKEVKTIAAIAEDCNWCEARFSPDDKSVALLYSHGPVQDTQRRRDDVRLQLLNCESGERLHDLTPYEMHWTDPYRRVCWSSDGKCVLAATLRHGSLDDPRIHIWDAHGGRHRADLAMAHGPHLVGMGFAASRFVIAANSAGEIYWWDWNDTAEKIRRLEASLVENK